MFARRKKFSFFNENVSKNFHLIGCFFIAMKKSQELGHKVEKCIVVKHLPRLSAQFHCTNGDLAKIDNVSIIDSSVRLYFLFNFCFY